MPCKVIFYFNQGAQGWTETYYSPANTPSGVILTNSTTLYQNLIACRAPGTTLFAMRVSRVDVPGRLSQTVFFGKSYVVPPQSGDDKQPDVASTDALLNLNSADGGNRKLFLRGLNDYNTLRGADFNSAPTGQLIKEINLLFASLTRAGFCIRVGVRPPAAGLTWVNVLNVFPQLPGGGIAVIESLENPNYPAGTQIIFQHTNRNDVPGFPRLAVTLSPFRLVAPSIWWQTTIAYTYRSRNVTYQPNGTMRYTQNTYQYQPIANYTFQAFAEHKTGRAFGVPRGRARVTVKAR